MEFIDSFLATGIGSVPHRDEKGFLDLLLKYFPEIPFLPQFPRRSFLEGMVTQYAGGFPSLKIDEKSQRIWIDTSPGFEKEVEQFYEWVEKGEVEPFRIAGEHARGLGIVEDLTTGNHREKIRYLKGQVTGPITFGLSLTDQDQKPIFYDPTLRDILVKHLSSKARWMEKRFRDLLPGIRTILFFDEPSLFTFGSAFSGLNRQDVLLSLNECFDAVQGLKGIHCCGNTDWGLLLETRLDILNFDAYGYLETLSLYPKELKAFLERGGILAWGIVPTNEAIQNEDARSLAKRLEAGIDTLSRMGIDPILLRRAILTPSCGTGSLPVPLAERVFQVTSELSKMFRQE